MSTPGKGRPSGRPCSVPACRREHYGRSFCVKHYRRWARHGDPTILLAGQDVPDPKCLACGKPVHGTNGHPAPKACGRTCHGRLQRQRMTSFRAGLLGGSRRL